MNSHRVEVAEEVEEEEEEEEEEEGLKCANEGGSLITSAGRTRVAAGVGKDTSAVQPHRDR